VAAESGTGREANEIEEYNNKVTIIPKRKNWVEDEQVNFTFLAEK